MRRISHMVHLAVLRTSTSQHVVLREIYIPYSHMIKVKFSVYSWSATIELLYWLQ
jgi:hypothetical protein